MKRYLHKTTEQIYEAVGSYQAVDGEIMTVLQREDGAKLTVSEDRLNKSYLQMRQPSEQRVILGMSVSEDGTVTKFINLPV